MSQAETITHPARIRKGVEARGRGPSALRQINGRDGDRAVLASVAR